jgi:hypothetical protein
MKLILSAFLSLLLLGGLNLSACNSKQKKEKATSLSTVGNPIGNRAA